MAKVRIIGTYQPARTPLHSVDARAKIGFILLMTIALFAAHSAVSLAVCVVLFAVSLLLSRTSPLQLVAALKPAGIVLAFSMVANTFVPAASADIPLGPLGLSGAGMVRGMTAVLRIGLLVGFALVLAATTTQTQLVDAFVSLLAPFKRIGLPVGDIAMSLSLALRFIPITVEEFGRISAAQAARGARLSDKSAIARIVGVRSVVTPLVVRLFSYADDIARSMARRGYDGSLGETDRRPLRIVDWLVLATGVAALVMAAML